MAAARVSIVVPTRARPESLRRCLDALGKQTIAAEAELIVVQDGHDVDLAPVVASRADVRLVRQARSGPGAARNRGAAEARTPILCFTDDDCEPEPDWAARLAAALERGADAVVGRTVNAEPHRRLSTASQLVVDHLREYTTAHGRPSFGPASNFGARAEVFRTHPFDASLRFAGGDRDWCTRIVRAELKLVYEPAAVVLHRQRLTLGSFLRQQFAYGRGSYRYRTKHGSAWRLERPGYYVSLLRRAFGSDPRVGALVALSQAATAVGFAREALRP